MNRLVIQQLPGGLSTASGGTRVSVKLDRPWQTDIVVDPSKCPFETRKQIQIATYEQSGGWNVLENQYTPFSWHRLIMPRTCWAKEQVRTLGGEEMTATALRIAASCASIVATLQRSTDSRCRYTVQRPDCQRQASVVHGENRHASLLSPAAFRGNRDGKDSRDTRTAFLLEWGRKAEIVCG